MQNYEKVSQWAATINTERALQEIEALKAKYPWLKCEESLKLIKTLSTDMPKIINIIKHQEKQNAMHRKFIDVSQIADEAIVNAITSQYNL
jgi:hypothetical protein